MVMGVSFAIFLFSPRDFSPGEPRRTTRPTAKGAKPYHRAMAAESAIVELAHRLRAASRVTVVTGAGVSAASGIPTFRGPGGIWRNFRPERLATAEAFAEDPRLVWEWYAWRRGLVARASPNRAHEVLAAWSRRYGGFALVTQNVDGLHERAGTRNVVRFHGSLWELSCADRCAGAPASWPDASELAELPPRCPHCGGLARPGVVWFGEAIPPAALAAASAALDCDVCLAVGTSAVVHPAARLVGEAAARGAFTAEINPEATPASASVDLPIPGRAEEVLDRLEVLLTGGET
jgi:NAD-dependent deacetylase